MALKNPKGRCLCGGVRYEVRGELRSVVACHCSQCRRTSGNFVTATNCGLGDIAFESDDSLRWYRSSESAERGFCCVCGSNLFWRPINGDHLGIMAGTLDTPTLYLGIITLAVFAAALSFAIDALGPVLVHYRFSDEK